jgi:PleD family two-component response regulator
MTLEPHIVANDHLRRRTSLLVEDEPFQREATSSILEQAGFEVWPAIDAAKCEEDLRTTPARSRSGDDGHGPSRTKP